MFDYSDLATSRGPKSHNFPDGNFQRAKTFRAECVNRFPVPWVVSENWQKSKVRPAGSLGLGRVSQSRQVHISYDWADMGKNILHISPCLVRDWQNSWLLIVMLYNSCWKKIAWAVKISWYRHQRLGFTAKPVPFFRMWTENKTFLMHLCSKRSTLFLISFAQRPDNQRVQPAGFQIFVPKSLCKLDIKSTIPLLFMSRRLS